MEKHLSNFRSIISTVFGTVPDFPLSGIANLWTAWSWLNWTLVGSTMSPHGAYMDILFLFPTVEWLLLCQARVEKK